MSGAMVSVPNIRRRRLGAALRRLREGSGMSLEVVAKELGWSTSKISRIELAKIAVTPSDVRALLGVLDALSEEVETLVCLAGEDRQPGWWRQYAEVLPPWFEGYLSLESEVAGCWPMSRRSYPACSRPSSTRRRYSATRPTRSYRMKQPGQRSCAVLGRSGSVIPTRYTWMW